MRPACRLDMAGAVDDGLRHSVVMRDQRDNNRALTGLQEQRERLEERFVYGWVTEARGPLTFDEERLVRIERVLEDGCGWTNEDDREYLDRRRAGAPRGVTLPAAAAKRRPFIDGVSDDFEFRVDERAVVLLFSHTDWPGVRFGHRFPAPDPDEYEHIWLKEAIETGKLHRLMERAPYPDEHEIVWTDWE
jgi:hypothetical protein